MAVSIEKSAMYSTHKKIFSRHHSDLVFVFNTMSSRDVHTYQAGDPSGSGVEDHAPNRENKSQ